MNILLPLLLWHLLPFVCVDSTGVIIKSGVAKNREQAQNENLHDVKFHKGIANFEGEEGFNKDDEKNSILAQDSGSYGEKSANKKAHLGSDNFQNENFRNDGGDSLSNLDSKVAHHKGHHKSGFTNSYHKDESGSNSSYFDDGSDEGGQIEHKNFRENHGDAAHQKNGGGRYDAAELENEQARRGLYDNTGQYEKDYENKRNYNKNNYYDNREDLDQRNLGNSYEGGARYAEEKYAQRPGGYYHHPAPLPYRRPPPPPLPQKHHITIYEDPRYVHSDPRYRRSDDYDYLDLDVRSPVERDLYVQRHDGDRRPDDYYYY